MLSYVYRVWSQQTEKCDFTNDYIFHDSLGGRHALGLAYMWDSYGQCNYFSPQPVTVSAGGDDIVRSSFPSSSVNPLTVAHPDGTVYQFYVVNPRGADGESLYVFPSFLEDRNGNKVVFSTNGSAATMTDTAGRAAVLTSGFGSTSGDTISVSGLQNPYAVHIGTISTSMAAPSQKLLIGDQYCQSISGDNESQGAVTSIVLRNGQEYQFQYDVTFGTLSKIIYPTGAYVSYSRGWSPLAEFGEFPNSQGAVNACLFDYDNYAILHRYVSFDGTNIALEQNFTYTTSWNSGGYTWSSK